MRRVLLVAAAVAVVSGCGTVAGTPAGTPPPAAPAPSVPAELKATCDALGKVYGEKMAPFAQSLTTMVGRRDAGTQKQARESLEAFAAAVDEATRASGDAGLKADGKKAADQLRAKAADAKFFAGIRTDRDVSNTLGPALKEWLSPVTRHCS
ncbi:hypothetical protein Ade02nite_09690 [Paractinoplanes deccanensis]|uniref:Lipoprotein n=1 Tax=Paractinoplanes deccanensis TaxID=113561 RepID=A0ABQ3XX42_9ACTN|nr:hypothetical protein [Actinoplanes deccanensis]GID72328.1 hypothetical protein Ade02nite_09690 [Actinoplanes deccanensis]